MREVTISEDLYNELWEYFDSRQDADHDGENFVPNKEMKLLHELQKAAETPFEKTINRIQPLIDECMLANLKLNQLINSKTYHSNQRTELEAIIADHEKQIIEILIDPKNENT